MKALLIALAFTAAILPASAQQPPRPRQMPMQDVATPAAQPEPQQIVIPPEYNLTFAPTDIDNLGMALATSEIQAKVANGLGQKIMTQVNAQIEIATKKAAEAKAEPKK